MRECYMEKKRRKRRKENWHLYCTQKVNYENSSDLRFNCKNKTTKEDRFRIGNRLHEIGMCRNLTKYEACREVRRHNRMQRP